MPNWCSNSLIIQGTILELNEIKKLVAAEETVFSFNNIVPLKTNTLSEAVEKWGVKWDLDEHTYITEDPEPLNNSKNYLEGLSENEECQAYEIGQSITTLAYSFSTPWSPADKVLEALSKLFPKVHLELYYEEEGMGLHGVMEFYGGKTIRILELPDRILDEDSNEYLNQDEIDQKIESNEGYLDWDSISDTLENLGVYRVTS